MNLYTTKQIAEKTGRDERAVQRHAAKLGLGKWYGNQRLFSGDDLKILRRSLADRHRGHRVLTESQVRQIKRRRAAGETLAKIAKKYGVTVSAISHIATGKNWAHVSGDES